MPSKRNKGDRVRKCHCVIERVGTKAGPTHNYRYCYATKNRANAAAKRMRKQAQGQPDKYIRSYKIFTRAGLCRQSEIKKSARKRRK